MLMFFCADPTTGDNGYGIYAYTGSVWLYLGNSYEPIGNNSYIEDVMVYGVAPDNTPVDLTLSDVWVPDEEDDNIWYYWDYTGGWWEMYIPVYTPPTDNNIAGWSSLDMYSHYLNGGGNVTLSQMGLLDAVKDFYVTSTALSNFAQQIWDYAAELVAERPAGSYSFEVSFARTYEYENLKFAFGGATLSGDFSGTVTLNGDGTFTYGGNAIVSFHDYFTDPYDTFDLIPGEWNPDGTPYSIDGTWNVTFTNE